MKPLGCIVPVSCIVVAILLFSPSHAAKHGSEDISCWKVNGYIWLHGYDKAYAWAAARYNKAQIEAVMTRCNITRNG